MFHPSKAWLMGFAAKLDFYNQATTIRKFNGNQGQPYPIDPFEYAGDIAGSNMLANSGMIVSDQRISGANAILFRDPSMIL